MYQAHLDMFRRARGETLTFADSISQRQADWSPASGKWSLGEVLDHLLLAEKLYRGTFVRLIELQKSGRRALISSSFSDVNTSVGYLPQSLLPFLEVPFTVFNMFVPSFVREAMTQFRLLPAQNPDIAQPIKGRPVRDLSGELRSSLLETEALFHSNPGLNYRQMRYRHPLMGDNNALQILRILALHERRHHSQMRDILQSRQFPKAA